MNKIFDQIPNMSPTELDLLRKNAFRILEQTSDPKKSLHADNVLAEIDSQLEKRYLPGMIKTFYEVYPGGFYGAKQAIEERDYKLEACQMFGKLLSEQEFGRLLEKKDFGEIAQRVSQLVGMTNLIQGSFEKPQLLDKIRQHEIGEIYFPALFNVIYDKASLENRFNPWATTLDELGLAKWTYATYFLFLADPDNCIFVKPQMLKKSLDLCKYPLEYDSTPSADLYQEIVTFSLWLKSKINELKPRDMIDVHSFMWHMAPTGKWADE